MMITKIKPCILKVTFGNGLSYRFKGVGNFQAEFGQDLGNKGWNFIWDLSPKHGNDPVFGVHIWIIVEVET